MRWLVTGDSGFVGGHVMRALRDAGHDAVGLGFGRAGDNPCDVTDPAALRAAVLARRPDRVIHLAGIAFAAASDADGFRRVHVDGTRNLLAACAALESPPAVALASSSAVYAASAGPLAESSPLGPRSDYGRSKLAMEEAAAAWSPRLPLLVVRSFNCAGPGQDNRFLVAKLADAFRRRLPAVALGDLAVRRDFTDVRDAAADYVRLLGPSPATGCVNLCSGRAFSPADLLDLLAALAGHRPQVHPDPSLLRPGEPVLALGDPSRLASLVGGLRRRPLVSTLSDMLSFPP